MSEFGPEGARTFALMVAAFVAQGWEIGPASVKSSEILDHINEHYVAAEHKERTLTVDEYKRIIGTHTSIYQRG